MLQFWPQASGIISLVWFEPPKMRSWAMCKSITEPYRIHHCYKCADRTGNAGAAIKVDLWECSQTSCWKSIQPIEDTDAFARWSFKRSSAWIVIQHEVAFSLPWMAKSRWFCWCSLWHCGESAPSDVYSGNSKKWQQSICCCQSGKNYR